MQKFQRDPPRCSEAISEKLMGGGGRIDSPAWARVKCEYAAVSQQCPFLKVMIIFLIKYPPYRLPSSAGYFARQFSSEFKIML